MRCIVLLLAVLFFLASCAKDKGILPDDNEPGSPADTVLLDVPYGADPVQRYDVYLPAGRDSTTAVLVLLHGGAWKAGQKEELNPIVNWIQQAWNGVAIVNMNYRLASSSAGIHHEEMMEDITAVLDHLATNQAVYGVSDQVGMVGASAGGQLAMIYTYRYGDAHSIQCVASLFGPSLIKDWAWYNSTNIWLGGYVGDILAEYVGQAWDSTAYENVSPYYAVDSNSQPTILFHGSLDPIVPVYQSQWMHGKLNGLGVENAYYEYLAFHGLDNSQSQDMVNKLTTFFQTYLP